MTKKIIDLFGVFEKEITSEIDSYSIDVPGLNKLNGKIFRGENYKLFPYIVLDCPKLFSANSVFAFRTMFWWGHEFSFTLHLQGHALEIYQKPVLEKMDSLKGKQVYFCVNDTPWQYNFEEENYLPIEKIILNDEILKRPFIKISRKLNLSDHEKTLKYGMETFKLFMGVLER